MSAVTVTTLTISEVAEAAHLDPATIRRRVRKGELHPYSGGRGGVPYSFTVSEALRWLRTQPTPPVNPTP